MVNYTQVCHLDHIDMFYHEMGERTSLVHLIPGKISGVHRSDVDKIGQINWALSLILSFDWTEARVTHTDVEDKTVKSLNG